ANDPGFPPFTIVSDKSLVISNSPAIMLIISRLRYISSIDFTQHSRKKSQREVAQVINDFEECYAKTQDGSAALASAIERMAVRNRTETDDDQTDSPDATEVMTADLDLISLVESIIANLVQGSSLDAEGVYITAFQDMVAEFTSKGRSDVRSFLEWWDSVGSKALVAGADDPTALNILTIHKAKGLQYACVHVPFAGFTINYSAVDRAWFKIPPLAGIPAEIMPPFLPLNMSKLMTTTSLEEPYNTYQKQRQIDFINLLYVALTRAVDELIVGIRVTGSDNSGQGSWTLANTVINAMRQANPSFCAQLLSEAALPPDTPSPFTPIDSIVDNIFEHGKPTVATVQQKNKDSALTPSAGETTTTYKVYGTKTPWENTRLSKDKVNRVSIARERGIILHQILARIATPADIGKAMQMTLASDDNRILSPDDAAELRRIVELRVNAPKARQWFTGFKRLLREQEVLTDSGSTKRFDRVVWTANGEIHLIDYKTGAQPASSYKSQILDYLNFFKSVGYIGVRAFLYYIDSGRITEIV
ncbi:MAG: hypothetical protein J1E29_08635, partial [Duncaniella sp.]|nr:hypothetical protein [Duncaniella sp.]